MRDSRRVRAFIPLLALLFASGAAEPVPQAPPVPDTYAKATVESAATGRSPASSSKATTARL